ncbi:hypothetical protein [Nonomuraea sp. bgisy101]|uniref:hypothetical protein n=1 Tax=Nonomuraea sp. bgisy101 TaxID=3413784 RepID=UPI003D75D2DB
MTINDITQEITTETPAKKKSKAKKRAAKSLLWFALLGTAVLVLAEPWLLIPAALLAAIALWD